MEVSTTTIEFTEAEREALEALRRQFTPEDRKRIEKQLAESAKVINRAARLPRQESERLCRAYDDGGRRIKREVLRGRGPLRTATMAAKPRQRERRPGQTRRASSSSTTSGSDPGDPDEPAPGWRWAHPVGRWS